MYAPNVNTQTNADLYPDAGGSTLAQLASGEFMVSETAGGQASAAPPVYGMGHPLVWAAVIVGGALLLGWMAHYFGRGEAYANTKVSAVTILVTGGGAVLFIYILKLLGAVFEQSKPQNGFSAFARTI